MILKFHNFNDSKTKVIELYPNVRHLTSYESLISILETGVIKSRNELKKNLSEIDNNIIKEKKLDSTDTWWNERKELENKRFLTENIIYCTPDWFNDSGYETGHGSVMIYFDQKIYEDFKVTLTIEDSLTEKRDNIYNVNEISKIYDNILGNENEYKNDAKIILDNLNHKNREGFFEISKGRTFVEGNRFYNKYSEIQIHEPEIPISYIKEICFTDNFLNKKNSDTQNKERVKLICKKYNIKINEQ